MSLKRNTLANYLGQGWTSVMGIVFIPFYIKLLGVEAFGLIGVLAVLQGAMSLLDLGMTPTINREMARYLANARTAESTCDLLRSFEIVYFAIGLMIVFFTWAAAPWLATHWLNAKNLPTETVSQALLLMACVVALRAWELAYRGAIQGLQKQVWLNGALATLATLRWGGALLVLVFVSRTIEAFFIWQGIVSVMTIIVFATRAYHWLPKLSRRARFNFDELRSVSRFTGGLALIMLVSLVLTQSDKIILAKFFSLETLGYYTLASTIASALAFFVYPLTNALYPRLTEQLAQNNSVGAAHTYISACQWLSALIVPPALTLAFFASPAIFVWCGDASLTNHVAPIVWILVLGNLGNALMTPPYMLQLAYGWTSFAVKTNIAAICLLLPAIFLLVPAFGAIGSASAWLALNVGYTVIGIPLMHRYVLPEVKWPWYKYAVIVPIAVGAVVAGVLSFLVPISNNRILAAAELILCGLVVSASVALSIPPTRFFAIFLWHSLKRRIRMRVAG
jgi:O-antigen/teichoic acid export membrane protein